MVIFNPDPSFNSERDWTVPFPKVFSPTIKALPFCCKAAVTISDADADPRLTRTTMGTSLQLAKRNNLRLWNLLEILRPLVLTMVFPLSRNRSLTWIACSKSPPGLLRRSRINPLTDPAFPSLLFSSSAVLSWKFLMRR